MKVKAKLILEETIRCIRERGLKETNSNIVAARLKMSPSNVFYYFPKQQDLFDSLVKFCVKLNREITAATMEKVANGSGEEQMLAYFKGNLSWAANHPEQVAVFFSGISDPNPKSSLRDIVIKALANGENRIASILARAVAGEEFTLKYKLETCSQIIHRTLIGLVVMQSVGGSHEKKTSLNHAKLCFESLILKC